MFSRASLFFGIATAACAPAAAHAHLGHLGEVAGHSHWAGVAALAGAAVLAGIVALKGRRKRDAEPADEADDAAPAGAEPAEA